MSQQFLNGMNTIISLQEVTCKTVAKRFKMSQSGVADAVNKGERIAKQRGINCLNELLIYQWMSLVPYF